MGVKPSVQIHDRDGSGGSVGSSSNESEVDIGMPEGGLLGPMGPGLQKGPRGDGRRLAFKQPGQLGTLSRHADPTPEVREVFSSIEESPADDAVFVHDAGTSGQAQVAGRDDGAALPSLSPAHARRPGAALQATAAAPAPTGA